MGRRTRRDQYDTLRRKARGRRLRRKHVVFTEGKTEAKFLEGIRQQHRLPHVDVRVVPQVGDPGRIVEEARDERATLRRSAGRQGTDWLIHVVFDRDEHPRFASACEDARQCNFVLGVSVPCFELWLILLKDEQGAPLSRRDAQRRCRELHAGYCHERNPVVDMAQIEMSDLDLAAERCRRLAERDPEERFPNPSSGFSRVLEEILSDLEER